MAGDAGRRHAERRTSEIKSQGIGQDVCHGRASTLRSGMGSRNDGEPAAQALIWAGRGSKMLEVGHTSIQLAHPVQATGSIR
jgi:hypothetical protein